MNTCKTCKWWIPYDGKDMNAKCLSMGDCANEKMAAYIDGSPSIMDSLSAGETLTGEMPSTGPNFGCVHWQALQPCNPKTHPPQEPA